MVRVKVAPAARYQCLQKDIVSSYPHAWYMHRPGDELLGHVGVEARLERMRDIGRD